MQFLGTLGIDVKLLVAQGVNFTLLLLILYVFVYRPILKKINSDEAKLREVETKSQQLKAEEEQAKLQEQHELEHARAQSEKLLAEAQEIAKATKVQAFAKAREEAEQILSQAKHQALASPNPEIKLAIGRLRKIFTKRKIYTEIDSAFFTALMATLRHDLTKYPEIDDFILEHAHPLKRSYKKEFTEFVKKYFGEEKRVTTRLNNRLISGFRVITNRLALDQNLLFEFTNAIKD